MWDEGGGWKADASLASCPSKEVDVSEEGQQRRVSDTDPIWAHARTGAIVQAVPDMNIPPQEDDPGKQRPSHLGNTQGVVQLPRFG